jgi:hypothetical protein
MKMVSFESVAHVEQAINLADDDLDLKRILSTRDLIRQGSQACVESRNLDVDPHVRSKMWVRYQTAKQVHPAPSTTRPVTVCVRQAHRVNSLNVAL